MKYPNHILLDVNKPSTTQLTSNWTTLYRTTFLNNNFNKFQKSILNNNVQIVVPIKKSSLFFKKNSETTQQGNSILWSIFDINFLKKEKIYTKLKYSRSPQYDTVSGGVAALFAGFIGFLISEKFGIELVDSGDFYTFFMYCVFLAFSVRPLLRVLSYDNTVYNFFSYKFLLSYINLMFNLFIKFVLKHNHITKLLHNSNQFVRNNEYFSNLYNNINNLIFFLKNYPKK